MPQENTIALEHDGTDLAGVSVRPETDGPVPAVLVMHDAMGLGPRMVEQARTLAAMGYVAVATDMFGGGAHFETPEEAGGPYLYFEEHPQALRSRVVAWFDHVAGQPDVDPDRIAAIGYCFGGRCVLELARSGADVRAMASFHGILSTKQPAEPGAIKGTIAVYTGANDPFVPPDQVRAFDEEMRAAAADYHLTVFSDGYHAFTDPHPPVVGVDGLRYDPLLDRVSWAATVGLLEHCLTTP